MSKNLYLLLALCCLAACAPKAELVISSSSIAEHMAVLASDEFMGRKPCTEGETKTLEYLVNAYQKMGLEPGNGESYLQEVPIIEVTGTVDPLMEIEGGKERLSLKKYEEFMAVSYRAEGANELDASELVFAGYGIVAPEYNWNDYKGLDVKGKTVIVYVNDPGYGTKGSDFFRGNAMTYYGRWTYKFEEAARQGAAGCIIVHDTGPAGYPWLVVRNSWDGTQLQLESKAPKCTVEAWITTEAAGKLFRNAEVDVDAMLSKMRSPDFQGGSLGMSVSVAIQNEFKRTTSNNVVGIIPGAKQPDEYILYSTHWDHLGIGPVLDGDSIYNGALDNASGTAMQLAIAETAAQGPAPDRTLVFLTVTAEEQGLIGSAYYAENPIFPTHKTIANLNMDGANTNGASRALVITGLGQSEMDDHAKGFAESQGRYTIGNPDASAGYYFRSDHFSFAKVGIPALYAKGGYDLVEGGQEAAKEHFEDYRINRYHRPQDEYDAASWKMEGMQEDAKLYLDIGMYLANSSIYPNWKEGSEFKAIREEDLKNK